MYILKLVELKTLKGTQYKVFIPVYCMLLNKWEIARRACVLSAVSFVNYVGYVMLNEIRRNIIRPVLYIFNRPWRRM
jgi:hypothetical protein